MSGLGAPRAPRGVVVLSLVAAAILVVQPARMMVYIVDPAGDRLVGHAVERIWHAAQLFHRLLMRDPIAV
jgi:hypothetical protein